MEIGHDKRWMSLLLWRELAFYANMQDNAAFPKPATSAFVKRVRLILLAHSKNVGEEASRFVFFAYGHRQLNVVKFHNLRSISSPPPLQHLRQLPPRKEQDREHGAGGH